MNFCFNINRLSVVVASLITPLLLLAEQPVSFKADLAPILLHQCQSCHGPKKSKGGYRVDTFERAMEVGFDELHYRMVTDDEDEIIPPCHVIPFHQQTLLCSPLCYLYGNTTSNIVATCVLACSHFFQKQTKTS